MKVRKIIALLFAALLLVGCNRQSADLSPYPPERYTEENAKIADFSTGRVWGFWARNDRGNGYPFNCAFSQDHAVIENGLLTLRLDQQGGRYVGAEYRSWEKLSYGYYSVRMKAVKCSGVISSFFTYTNWPWDEIDIEFLGNDTTKIQFNYYTNGIGGHEYVYDLGFDASEDFHEYGFDWREDAIVWYVDGKAVYAATENIPSTPGHLMVNLWNLADDKTDWAGKFDPSKLPVEAQYAWFGYQSADSTSDMQKN